MNSEKRARADAHATDPGLAVAFEYVRPSYDWMLARLQAADTRIQAIQAFAIVFTFGVPGVARALNSSVSFESGLLHLALLCFTALMIVGIIGQARGPVRLANPALIYRNALHFSEWELKKKAVQWAGEHFEINGAIVRMKANVSLVMAGLILLELLFLFAWLINAS